MSTLATNVFHYNVGDDEESDGKCTERREWSEDGAYGQSNLCIILRNCL